MTDKVWTPDSGQLPPEKLDILSELNEAFEGDRGMISEYLSQFGWSKVVAPNLRIIRRWRQEHPISASPATDSSIEEEREADAASTDSAEPGSDTGPLKSCYYEVDVKCPFCETIFRPSVLRNKALILSYDYKNPHFPLMVPCSHHAMKGYEPADPLLRAALVCPNCLYASSSLGGFLTTSAVSGTRGLMARLPERKIRAIRARLEETIEERRAVCRFALETADEGRWGAKRTTGLAAEAFLLVARCSELIAEHEPTEYYRAGDALLSAARLFCDVGQSDRERQCLTEARGFFDLSFQFGSVSALPVYLIGVILYHLGDLDGSRNWIGRVITDRGKLLNSVRYKRFCENLIDVIRVERHA
jgi:uncharacterized protein (DUF2225 family)